MTRLLCAALLGITVIADPFSTAAEAAKPNAEKPRSEDGSIERFRFSGDSRKLILLPVRIADKKFFAVLDTGNEITIYDKSLKQLLGPVIAVTEVRGWQGAGYCELVRTPSLFLGNQRAKSLSELALCHDLSNQRRASGQDFHAILGLDVLRNLVIQIDFAKHLVSVFDEVPEMDDEGIAMSDRDGMFEVSATIRGFGRERFLLDTGFAGTDCGSTSRETFSSLKEKGLLVSIRSTTAATAFGDVRQREGTLSTSFLQGTFEEKSLVFSEGELAVLGLGYLSRFVVTLDFPHQTMYLQRPSEARTPDNYPPNIKAPKGNRPQPLYGRRDR